MGKSLNFVVLSVFGPLLILTGVLGFLLPARWSLMSGAAAYNVFHIFFGAVGLTFVFLKNERLIHSFNIGFGLLDLYQAAASLLHLFPESYFRWTRADDALHVVLGLGLVAIGLCGRSSQGELNP